MIQNWTSLRPCSGSVLSEIPESVKGHQRILVQIKINGLLSGNAQRGRNISSVYSRGIGHTSSFSKTQSGSNLAAAAEIRLGCCPPSAHPGFLWQQIATTCKEERNTRHSAYTCSAVQMWPGVSTRTQTLLHAVHLTTESGSLCIFHWKSTFPHYQHK